MLKFLKYLFGIALVLAVLGTLGMSIASLITVLNIQDTINSQYSTAPIDPTAAKPDPTSNKPETTSSATVPTTATSIKTTSKPTDAPVDPVKTSPALPDPSTTVNTIPVAKPIIDDDPRYPAYQGMSQLLSTWMNRSINPCDDFYEYTCGAGKKGQEMSFDLSDDSITESMVEQLRKPSEFFNSYPLPVRQMKWFYDMCMTGATQAEFAARSVKIFNDLKKNNPKIGFPALYPTDSTSVKPDELAAFLGDSLGTIGFTSIVDVGVDTDWKDPHNPNGGYALLVDQPATMYQSTYYAKIYDADSVVASIVDTINAGALLLGVRDVDQKQVIADAKEVAQLDYELATKYSTDDTTRRQFARSYNPYSVEGMQKLAPFLDWKTFFDHALQPTIGKTVDGSFRTIVMEVDKLGLLSADISSGVITPRAINNYLYVIALNQNYLPDPVTLREKSAHLQGVLREKRPINRKIRKMPKHDPLDLAVTREFTARENNCQALTTQFLTWANTRLFVDANYPTDKDKQTVREQTTSMVSSILVAFRAQIDLLDWMTPASKKGAYQKIDNLVVNIAFPDWVLDDAKLTDYYKKLVTKQDDAYLAQIDQLSAFGLYEAFSPLVNGAPSDRTDFSGPAAITNAWYQPEVNSITFPGGILHAPFYDFNYPAAINYGGLGVIAGHELTHGFDDQGVQWEGTGILNSWMDDNSTKSFTDMAQCVVSEYSNFCPLADGQPCVDGDQTQGENIADNGGIQAAYKAYKAYEALHGPDPLLPGFGSAFTADQLFFLGFAQVWCQYPPSDPSLLNQILVDPHSPSLYRVLGTVQNIPAFQKAFNCPLGSTYAPVGHCNVWTSEPTTGAPLNTKGEPVVPENDVNVAPAERISPQDMEKYSVYQNTLAIYKASAKLTVDPCDDFYQYSCGNYPGVKNTFYDLEQANNKVIYDKINDPDYQETIANSSALTMLQILYTSCKAEANQPTTMTTNYLLPKVLQFRNAINQDIPLIGGTGKVDVTPENYGKGLGFLSFQLGIDTLVTPMVDTYWLDPQAALPETTNGYQLFIDQASTYHGRAFYEDENWAKQKDFYYDQVKTVVEAYAKQDDAAQLPTDYEQMIDDALELERTIAINYSRTDVEGRNYQRQWNLKKFNELPTVVDWDKYFSLAPTTAQEWIKTKSVVMNEIDYTSDMFNFFGNTNDATLVNYLFIRLILANSGLIPCANGECVSVMRALAKKKVPEYTGKSRIVHRRLPLPSRAALNDEDADGMGCAEEIGVMADAQARVYIDGRFPTEDDRVRIRSSINGVMTNIVNSMKSMIDQLDWMEPDTKTKALKKASNIQVNAAFPDFILNTPELDAKYEDLDLDQDDSYYAMLDKITAYTINQQFAYLGDDYSKADRSDFLGQTAVVNAWYDPELNSITFPAGILVQPYFDVDYPAGMNYGGVGIVAGHELTHGFDDEGVQWDFDGRLNSWMDAKSQTGFDKMAQCVIDEYSTFCPLPEGFSPRCTDGVRTQGENIADNGGIHSSWRAYQAHLELDGPDPLFMDRVFSQYSENQLFFLNFAQLWCTQKNYMTDAYIENQLMTNAHSLGMYRTLGTLQNIPAFQTNFNCQRGSTYAPVDHCSVWVPTKMA